MHLSRLDGPLTLRENLYVVDIIHTGSNKFVTGVKIKMASDPRLNDNHLQE